MASATRIEAPIRFPHVEWPPLETPGVEAVHWACEALRRTATVSNSGNNSSNEMLYGKSAPASPHPFPRPGYCSWNRLSNSFPRCESSFYFRLGINHPRYSLRMQTQANEAVKTRDVTMKVPPDVERPPVQLHQSALPVLAGESDAERTLEPAGASEL